MKENVLHKNPEKQADSKFAGNHLSEQEALSCLSAAGLLTPADRQAVKSVGDKISNIFDNRNSMAESVTRHASTPYIAKLQNQIIFGYLKIIIIYDELITITRQYGCAGRESLKPIHSLHNSLPEIAEQYLILLKVVESGRESAHMQGGIHHICELVISKAIDQSKNEGYSHNHGKSDRIEGPRKEINNGSI